jgi:glycosyltransferase involved in cell wall biosynthesis
VRVRPPGAWPFATGMKILLLTTLMEAGGAQKALLQLARGLRQRGHDVTVVTMYDKVGIIPHFERRFGLPIQNLRMKRIAGNRFIATPGAVAGGLWRMYQTMRHGHFDVLQTFCHYSNIIGQPVGALARIPIRVASQRNRLDAVPRIVRVADRLIANSPIPHRMVAVSESNRRYCIETQRIRAEKLLVIENGIDPGDLSPPVPAEIDRLRAELGVAGPNFVVTMVGRLHPQKDHDCLLRAVAAVAGDLPSMRVLLIGDGRLRDQIAERIAMLGLGARVQLLGERRDVAALLALSDLFVLPSRWEGMPNAVLEAMSASLPVLATRVDGIVDVVQDGKTGVLVQPGDDRALAAELLAFGRDPARRRALGSAGRRRIELAYSLNAFVDGFERLYLSLLQRRAGHGAGRGDGRSRPTP